MKTLMDRMEGWTRFGFYPQAAWAADWGRPSGSRWVVLVDYNGHGDQTFLHGEFASCRAAKRSAEAINDHLSGNSNKLASV